MLEFAKKYEDQLKTIYYDTAFDDWLKWAWGGIGRQWCPPSDSTKEYHNFVSTHNDQVLGEVSYYTDRIVRKATIICCIHYSKDNGYTFMKDTIKCLCDIFEKFGFNKLSYSVVVGNPAERNWDKLTEKFGGRIIGTLKEDTVLQDGRYYDVKEYEILAEEYFVKKRDTA